MSEELLTMIPGRPAVVKAEGWTVYVSIRDAEYIRNKKNWKRTLADVHPDRNNGKGKRQFAKAYMRYQTFLNEARREYWKLGLMPPDWRGEPKAPVGLIKGGVEVGFEKVQRRLEENN